MSIDHALADQEWLVENSFSLADIAWVPNVHRLDVLGYPLALHPNWVAWYNRFKARPSYVSALQEQEPIKLLEHFQKYLEKRQAEKTDVRQFGPLADGAASPKSR